MTLYLVVGPPASGKSSWVAQRAKHGDITIDFDAIASVLTKPGDDPHSPPEHIRAVAKAARLAAIDTALRLADSHDVYVIHSTPSAARVQHYRRHGARVICIDPGEDVVMERIARERPWRMRLVARKWYADQRAGLVPHASKLPSTDGSRQW